MNIKSIYKLGVQFNVFKISKKIFFNHSHDNCNIFILTWYIRMNRTSKLMPNCTNLNHKPKKKILNVMKIIPCSFFKF